MALHRCVFDFQHFKIGKLQRPEMFVYAVFCQQRGMGTLLDNLSVLQDDDAVGALNGGQAVGDDKRGAAASRSAEEAFIFP